MQKTSLEEFWPTVDIKDPDLERRLAEWQHYYNWERSHDSLGGLTPIDRVCERPDAAPLGEQVFAACDPSKEPIQPRDYFAIRRSKN